MIAEASPSFHAINFSIPPQNTDAEESILGGILLDPQAIERVATSLPVEAFFINSHQHIYRAMLTLHNQGIEPDLMGVVSWLSDRKLLQKVGGQSKLAQLVDRTVSSVNIDRYAALVVDKYRRREIIALANELALLGHDTFREMPAILNHIEERYQNTIIPLMPSAVTDGDPEYKKYSRLIESIRQLELTISDPGYRTWRLQKLAKQHDRTPKQLEDLYFKSLITEENEPLMDFDQAIERYGSSVREWLLHGFLPKGSTVLLHAEGGVGKTRLAYEFVFHLATGQSWGSFPVTASGRKCLIVQTDESASDMLSTLADRGFDSSMSVRYKTRWTTEHIQQLRQEILDYQPECVVIDSLTTINKHSIFSENDAEYARPILLLRDLAQELGVTILIIHHDNKQGTARGTGAIFNSVSEVLSLKRDPNNQQPDATARLLTIEKSRSRKPARYRLEFNPEDKSWECTSKEGEDENNPNLSTKEAIIQFLTEHRGVAYEVIEIHSIVGGTIDHLRRCAYELAEDGVISRVRKDPKSRKSAYKYFVGGSGETDHDQNPITSRSVNDQINDQIENADTASITPSSDHLITKNAIFQQQGEGEKNQNLMIRRSDDPQTLENQGNLTDHSSDHLTDHQLITPLPMISNPQPNQRVIVRCLGSKNDGAAGTILRLVELEDKTTEALVKLDKDKKIHVPVPGHEHFCLLNKPEKPKATPDNSHQLTLDHQAQPGEMQKGDRVLSQMSGKEGEVTERNSRYTYISWDRNREMGLPADQYTASDLEVMRIVKAEQIRQ